MAIYLDSNEENKEKSIEDIYLDNMKRRGYIVWKCKDCGRRFIGAGATYHGFHHPLHTLENEDKMENQK
jgi:ribosomal protein L37AE/L43A